MTEPIVKIQYCILGALVGLVAGVAVTLGIESKLVGVSRPGLYEPESVAHEAQEHWRGCINTMYALQAQGLGKCPPTTSTTYAALAVDMNPNAPLVLDGGRFDISCADPQSVGISISRDVRNAMIKNTTTIMDAGSPIRFSNTTNTIPLGHP